jgi:hypothetical protein
MVVIILPEWYSKAEEKLDRVINEIAKELNFNLTFVWDSKSIENGKSTILNTLVRLSEQAKPEFTKEELKNFKAMEQAIEKEEKENAKSKHKLSNKKQH